MPERPYCFIVALLIFFNGEIFSQEIPHIRLNKPYPQAAGYAGITPNLKKNIFSADYRNDSAIKNQFTAFFLSPITPNFYSKNLSFFCKKELQIEKTTSIPFRFRLGSTDYVNFLEQKPNALRYP